MSRAGPNRGRSSRQVIAGAVAVHDVALLVAVFWAPIFWGGFNTSGQAFVSAVVAIAVLAALVARWAQGSGPARIPNAIHVPAAALLGISALSAVFSVSRHASVLEVCRLGVGVLVFWLVANRAALPAGRANLVAAAFACSLVLAVFIPVPDQAGTALRIFCVIGVGAVCAVIVSRREGPDPMRWWWAALVVSAALVVALYGVREKIEVWRQMNNPTWAIFSTFFNPNPLAGFFAMVFPLALSAAVAAAVLWRRLLWGFCALVVAGAILPTYSKGGMLALAVGAGCYVLLMGWQWGRARRLVGGFVAACAAVAVVVGLAILVSQPVRARAVSAVGGQSASNMFRILTWKATVDLASAHPWIGVGPGGFKYIFPKHAIAGYVEAAHQNYLQVFAEQGVFGGAVFLWLVAAVVFTGKRALGRAEDFRGKALAIGGLCSIIALLAHSFLDYDWYIGAIGMMFWVVAGMLAHWAHGRPVAEPAPVEEAPRRRRRGRGRERSGAGDRPGAELTEEGGGRPLPWPRSGWGRGAAIFGLALAFALCVWGLTNVALAQQAVRQGDELVMTRHADTGLWAYRRATQYDPWSGEAWERYGLLRALLAYSYEQREDEKRRGMEEGVEAIKRAMALEPTNFKHIATLARLYREAGRLEEAARYYRKSLESFPKHTKSLRHLGEVYELLGDEERAIRAYRDMLEIEDSAFNKYRALAVDVDVEYAYAHYELGRFAVREQEAGRAADGLQVGLGEFNEALRVIADYFERAEETDKMFLMLRRPREYRAPNMHKLEAKVRWRMADVYEKLGDAAREKAERERARASWPQVADEIAAEDGGDQG